MIRLIQRTYNHLMDKVPKPILFRLGNFFMVMGVIGTWVPAVWPHTPFFLAALLCYQKCSKEQYERLLAHPRFGPPLRDWLEHSIISRKTKLIALLMIAVSVALSAFFVSSVVLKYLVIAINIGAAIFILKQPSK